MTFLQRSYHTFVVLQANVENFSSRKIYLLSNDRTSEHMRSRKSKCNKVASEHSELWRQTWFKQWTGNAIVELLSSGLGFTWRIWRHSIYMPVLDEPASETSPRRLQTSVKIKVNSRSIFFGDFSKGFWRLFKHFKKVLGAFNKFMATFLVFLKK